MACQLLFFVAGDTMTIQRTNLALCAFLGLFGACSADPPPATATATFWRELRFHNGITTNGLSRNGIESVDTVGIDYSGVTSSNGNITNVSLNGSQLTGTRNSETISGADFTGAVFPAVQVDGGSDQYLQIGSVTYDSQADLHFYALYNYGNGCSGTDCPACGWVDPNAEIKEPILALPVAGIWNIEDGSKTANGQWTVPNTDPPVVRTLFTFSCVNAAVGKCALWGYRPWASHTETLGESSASRSLADWHQACTRLVRADYCGNGKPHTRDGTPINVWDDIGIQAKDTSTSTQNWTFDAQWGVDGAHCINRTRWAYSNGDDSDQEYIDDHCSTRMADTSCPTVSGTNPTPALLTSSNFTTSTAGRPLIQNTTGCNDYSSCTE